MRDQLLYEQEITLNPLGNTIVRIEFPNPAAGVYLLEIRGTDVRLRRKILVW